MLEKILVTDEILLSAKIIKDSYGWEDIKNSWENIENEWMSPQFWTTIGQDPKEKKHLASEWQDLIHPDDLKVAFENFQQHCANPQHPYDQIVRYFHKDGSTVWVRCRGIAIRDNSGKPIRMLGAHNDLTKLKQAEQELKQNEFFLLKAQELGKIGHFNYDPLTNHVAGSPELFRIFDVDPDLPLFDSFAQTVHPEDGHLIFPFIDRAVKEGISYDVEFRICHQDGIILHVNAKGERNSTLTGNRVLGIVQDITEKKQLEIRLQQAQKMESIGNLAGGIAHDFNNLLFPIIGMSEMLLDDLPEDSLEYENANEIFHAGKRAGELVKQILAFSRQSEHLMKPVRIQNILKEVLKLSRSTIPTNIKIHHNIQQNCRLVIADPTQVHQVAMNLITNAFHAVEEKNGLIDIELKEITLKNNDLPESALQPGQYVKLSVSDNGIGIEKSLINNIFEPYFTTKKKGKGTGLGLAVVYGIVKEHNGDVKVCSEPAKGTTFNVYLPLMIKAVEIAATNKGAGLETGTERILLVDDEESVAMLERQMLERLGYKVTAQTSSIDALNAFKANPEAYDLVISDMTMPEITGDQLAEKMLSIKPGIPIIICTGFSEKINKEQTEIIGMKGLLMKPVVKSDLAQMVRRVLDEANV